jgi:hypothetical protein
MTMTPLTGEVRRGQGALDRLGQLQFGHGGRGHGGQGGDRWGGAGDGVDHPDFLFRVAKFEKIVGSLNPTTNGRAAARDAAAVSEASTRLWNGASSAFGGV